MDPRSLWLKQTLSSRSLPKKLLKLLAVAAAIIMIKVVLTTEVPQLQRCSDFSDHCTTEVGLKMLEILQLNTNEVTQNSCQGRCMAIGKTPVND